MTDSLLKRKKRSFLNLQLPLSVLLLLFIGGFSALQDKHDFKLNNENRNPNRIPILQNLDEFLNGQYQSKLENALLDQLPLNQFIKQFYFKNSNRLLFWMQKELFNYSDYYVNFRRGIYLFGDKNDLYMMSNRQPLTPEKEKNALELASLINQAIVDNPKIDFYVYYVTNEKDIRFDNMTKSSYWSFFSTNLNLPPSHKDSLPVSTFDDYKQYFYHTDHHWNHTGSYKGYTQIFEMLQLDAQNEKLITPIEENDSSTFNLALSCKYEDDRKSILLSSSSYGSKSIKTGYLQMFKEKFLAYRFSYPEMNAFIKGKVNTFGNEEAYFGGLNKTPYISYEEFYGKNYGETVIQTNKEERPNIMIIGDSYDNPIIKLIASHFHRTYSIDLRYYAEDMGEDFILNKYIHDNRIDTVLFVIDAVYIDELYKEMIQSH